MTIGDNVEYGPRIAKVPREERRRRAGRGARARAPERLREALARPALRRPAPARRARARDRQPPEGAAARRAARRARPQAAPGDAGRAQAHPGRRRHHLRLRHARPGGGADDERPPRRLQRGPDRAGRPARRGLRAPRQHVRGRLRRRLEPARARRPPLHDPPREDRRSTPPGRASTSRRAASATSPTPGWSPATSSTSTRAASCRWSARTSRRPRPTRSSRRAGEVRVGWRDEHTFAIENKEEA